MIIFPNSLILSASTPLRHSRIGYQTYTFDATAFDVVVSSETEAGPRDAPLRPDTAEFWEADALPAWWEANFGELVDIDYVGLVLSGVAGFTVLAETTDETVFESDTGTARAGSDDGLVLKEAAPMIDGTLNHLAVLDDGRSHAIVEQAVGESTAPGFPALWLDLPGTSGNYASTPDSAALDVTGVLDIRAEAAPADWTPAITKVFLSKFGLHAQRQYKFELPASGQLQFRVTPNGGGGGNLTGRSSVPVGASDGSRLFVRVTYQEDTGGGDYMLRFYTSADGQSWTQLGTDLTGTSVAIFQGDSPVTIGFDEADNRFFTGQIFSAEIRNGIDGTVVARFDARDAKTGATSFASKTTGETWTINQSGDPNAHLVTHNAVRVEPEWSALYLDLPGTSGNYASTPDSAAVSVTGDIDIRVKVALDDWTPPNLSALFSKRAGSSGEYSFRVTTTGALDFFWFEGGVIAGPFTSTNIVGAADGSTKWVRVTRDNDDGGGNHVIKFYTSDDNIVWTQLGTTITTAATPVPTDTTNIVRIGEDAGGTNITAGLVHYAEIRNGIDGTVVARFDPTEANLGDTSWASGQTGETWTVNQSGSLPAKLAPEPDATTDYAIQFDLSDSQREIDNLVYTRFSDELMPADDAPIMLLDTLRTVKRLRVTESGSGDVPRLAVCYAGLVLAMARPIYGGHTPLTLSRETELFQPLSRGGQFLGQRLRRLGVRGSAQFRNLPAAWYRENVDPFVVHAREFPYFFAWRPSEFTNEVGFVWTPSDIAPQNQGNSKDWMQVNWDMIGVGCE